jgi:hypothetical protein
MPLENVAIPEALTVPVTLPVRFPVTFPVTFPVRLPVKLVALTTPTILKALVGTEVPIPTLPEAS